MKIWFKYLIGIAFGIAFYAILPTDKSEVSSVIQILSDFAIRFGRYSLIPLLLFGTATAVYRLRSSKVLLKTSIWTFAMILFFTFLLTSLGIFSALIIKLPRLPITGERLMDIEHINVRSLLEQLVPFSAFDSISHGAFLMPAFVFAAFIGAACASEKENARPVTAFIESAARIFHNISSFFVEWISIGLIAISCFWFLSTKSVFLSSVFVKLFLLLLVDFLIFAIIICPLFIWVFCKDPRPFHVLYASIAAVISAFFSADTNFALVVNLRHGRESLGIRDEVNSFSFPLFASFCRGGTALVISVCFVSIIRSYVDLGIRSEDVTWLFGASFVLSFALCAFPQGGTFVALTVICSMYGRGFSDGYLLLRPTIPLLCSIAAAFDATSALYGSYVTAVKTKAIDHNVIKKYI